MNLKEFEVELKKIGINVDNDKISKLEKYYDLLIEYNKVMNLTGITNHDEVYLKHFYDSLTIIKVLDLNKVENLCDLGSGAGFPGIVLKIFFPNLRITLIDSQNKRIKFLNVVIEELKLKNIEAIHSRIEDYAKTNQEKYDVVTARAVAPLNILLELGINLVKINKYFIAMKGNIKNEPSFNNAINILKCKIERIVSFKLPIEESDRSLVCIIKNSATPKKYPRKYCDVRKKTL